ncbi:hypothetical protein ABIB25_000161 [Nakamurella sp. UYEF19]
MTAAGSFASSSAGVARRLIASNWFSYPTPENVSGSGSIAVSGAAQSTQC